MNSIKLELEEEITTLLYQLNQSVQNSAREFIILELYRRGMISSGKAAQLLDMSKLEFIHYSSRLGIPFFSMTEDEWETEKKHSEIL